MEKESRMSFVQIDCRNLLSSAKYLLAIAKVINENCNTIQENWREPEKAKKEMGIVLKELGAENIHFLRSIKHIEQFYERVSEDAS